ncbi:MAG: cell division protein FtsA [Chitinispirillales bacterium]|jgi:cell division protein FtsA|nr:cell division protein FtsA [Chitinispirillales bacterium]
MDNDLYVGLDIGTTKVACIIATRGESGGLEVVGVGKCNSIGLKKGVMRNMQNIVESIQTAVKEAELMAGVDVDDVWVGIAGDHIRAFDNPGYVAMTHEDREIRQEDIDRVIESAKTVKIPEDYEQLHVIPKEFRVDNLEGIKQPLGMIGVRLETQVHIITAQITSIQNITKCVKDAGLRLNKLVLDHLASSYSVLDKDEKELGVALVDIGGGTSNIAVYHDDNIRHVSIVKEGGEDVTRDISIVLKTPPAEAEKIKKSHGCAYLPLLRGDDESLMIKMTGNRDDREIKRSLLVEVIEARMDELLGLVRQDMEKSGLISQMGAGVVLTGGGSQMPGMREKAESVFHMPVRIGCPQKFGGLADMVRTPKFSTGVGLCMFGLETAHVGGVHKSGKKKSSGGESGYNNIIKKVFSWFSKYF